MKNQQLVEFIKNCDKRSICQSPKNILIKNGFDDYTFLVDENDHKKTRFNLYAYAYGYNYCIICGKIVEGFRWRRGWNKTCCETCENITHSERQKGDKNSCHKLSDEQRKEANNKTSNTLKNKILRGEYTPKSENYRIFRMIQFKYNEEIRSVRSLWELIYWMQNPELQYEKIRLTYFDEKLNKNRVYITDFYDDKTNTIIEIKPKKYQDTLKNKKESVLSAGYTYIILDEDYFKNISPDGVLDNIQENVLNFDVIETRLKRLKWLK